jgi:hypothetical protein
VYFSLEHLHGNGNDPARGVVCAFKAIGRVQCMQSSPLLFSSEPASPGVWQESIPAGPLLIDAIINGLALGNFAAEPCGHAAKVIK